MFDIIYMHCRYANSKCLVHSNLCKLFLCACVFGTIKTALRCITVVWDGNYNGLRSMWLREEEELKPLTTSLPGSGSAGQSSKGQKVKMGGGFCFPEAGSHQSICQVVSAMVLCPGLVTLVYGVWDVTAAPTQPEKEEVGAVRKSSYQWTGDMIGSLIIYCDFFSPNSSLEFITFICNYFNIPTLLPNVAHQLYTNKLL